MNISHSDLFEMTMMATAKLSGARKIEFVNGSMFVEATEEQMDQIERDLRDDELVGFVVPDFEVHFQYYLGEGVTEYAIDF